MFNFLNCATDDTDLHRFNQPLISQIDTNNRVVEYDKRFIWCRAVKIGI